MLWLGVFGVIITAIGGLISRSRVRGWLKHTLHKEVDKTCDDLTVIFILIGTPIAIATMVNGYYKLREANLKAVEERLARIKLEERVAWRRLTKDQQSEIGSRLSRFSGQLAAIWYKAGDHEGGAFASDIAAALELAKWNVFAPASMLTMAEGGRREPAIIETGIIIASTGDKASLSASDALVHELLALGFDASYYRKVRTTMLVCVVDRGGSSRIPYGPSHHAAASQARAQGS